MTHRRPFPALVALATAALLAGCGAEQKSAAPAGADPAAGSAAAGPSEKVLRVPFLADMSVPDPDVFYDIEGNSVILNTYEGLVRYEPGSTKIVGDLAKRWKVSGDRLTYTFDLQPGIKFHSGAPVTAKAVKASFQRRIDVDQAPAYMLKSVESMSTPAELRFVVKLKRPVNPFLHYMASSWGPKIIGPAALETNAGADNGEKWLRSHEDGTGPYEITAFERGRQYELTRSDDYWGDAPYFKKLLFKITPDVGTQRLELQSGDLDAVLHSFPASELESLPDTVNVLREDTNLRMLLYVNTHRAPFSDAKARAGLRSTLDVDALVQQAYSGTATASTGPYPSRLLESQPELPYQADPAAAKAAAGAVSDKEISLAYSADESGVLRRASELLQAQLAAAGYDVTLKEVQLPQVYGFVNDLENAPDLMLGTNTPDAAHPDTWARIVFYSSGGLNFLGYKDKQADALVDKALSASTADADELYRQAGQRVIDSNALFFLGDVKDVFVVSKKLTGIEHTPAYPWTFDMAKVKEGGS